MNSFRLFFIIMILLSLPAVAADRGEFISRQKKFIRELFSEKRYFDAIAETRRLIAHGHGSRMRDDCNFFINVNYYLGGQYKTVVNNIAGMPVPPDTRSAVLLSQSYLRLGMNSRGLGAIRGIGYDSVSGPGRYPLLARKAEAYIACGMYRELLEEIREAEGYLPGHDTLAMLREEVERYRRATRVSAPLAVALSVFIPGAGQMYAGKYLSGVLSFVGVAATAAGAFLLYRQGSKDLSFTCIFFSSVFYLGNIYGAYNSARHANEEREITFRDSMKRGCVPAYDPVPDLEGNRAMQ
ncbi:MAG: hypothetical protein JW807_10585 [Spirochaetes bacterium]|nr:hypothetical protein [Spirochaetota bacterium]